MNASFLVSANFLALWGHLLLSFGVSNLRAHQLAFARHAWFPRAPLSYSLSCVFEQETCEPAIRRLQPRHMPSLFQHVGQESSLVGKRQRIQVLRALCLNVHSWAIVCAPDSTRGLMSPSRDVMSPSRGVRIFECLLTRAPSVCLQNSSTSSLLRCGIFDDWLID